MNKETPKNPNPISLLSLSKLGSLKTNHPKSLLCKNHLSFTTSFNTERAKNPKSHLYKKNIYLAPSINSERTENSQNPISIKKPSILVVKNPKSHLYKKTINLYKKNPISLNRRTFSFYSKPDLNCRNRKKWMRKKSCRNGRKWLKKKNCMV
ncbi:hypothetical protein AMTRI_Chr03g144420 [Amborella trichopoda]